MEALMISRNKLYAAVAAISLMTAIGCTTTPSPLEKSTSIDEYFYNAAYVQKDGSKIYDQYAIKALFIKNIIETTNWPDGKKQNLQICMIGDDDFHGKLEKMASLVKQEKGHEWHIKRGIQPSDIKHCDVLYAGFIYSDHELQQYLQVAVTQPVLTIGEDKNFSFYGGMITLKTTADNHIDLHLNLEAAKKLGFKFDKELLEVVSKDL